MCLHVIAVAKYCHRFTKALQMCCIFLASSWVHLHVSIQMVCWLNSAKLKAYIQCTFRLLFFKLPECSYCHYSCTDEGSCKLVKRLKL